MLVLSWNIKKTMSSWIWLQEEQADFMLLQEVSPKSVMMGNGSIIMGHDSDPSVAAVASYKHPIERWDIIPRITDPDLKRMMEYLELREKKFGDKEGTRGRLVGASSEVDGKKWILISFHAAPLKTPLDAQKVYLGLDPHQKELTKEILGPQIIEKIKRPYSWEDNKEVWLENLIKLVIKDLIDHCDEIKNSCFVFGGDLNICLGFDNAFKRKNNDNKYSLLEYEDMGLTNCLRLKHKNEHQSYIHTVENKKGILFQNDHLFINQNLKCKWAYVIGRPLQSDNRAISDHNPIIGSLRPS